MQFSIELFKRLAGIDFETYWDKDYTLKKLSTTEYIRHPKFQILGASIRLHGQPAFFLREEQMRLWLKVQTGLTVLAHHANFDAMILTEKLDYNPKFIIDTMGMSRIHWGPLVRHQLDTVAKRLGLPGKISMPLFKGTRAEDLTGEQWAELATYANQDADTTYDVARLLLPHRTKRELRLIDAFARMYVNPELTLDIELVKQAHDEELQRREALLKKLGLPNMDDLRSPGKVCELFKRIGVEVEMKKGKNGSIPALAKSDPFMQGLLEHDDSEVVTLAEARLASKSTQTMTRALRMLALVEGGHKMPVYYNVSAAHTHRIGGSDAVNFTNLERVHPIDPKKGRLRKAIKAPDGFKLIVRDSSQIEARKASWWAMAKKLTSAFNEGRDVYSEQASDYFHRKVDRKSGDPDDKQAGDVGKVLTLGGTYGMGGHKAAVEFIKGPMGTPSRVFTEEDIEKLGIGWHARDFVNNEWKMERLLQIPTRLTRRAMLAHTVVADYFVMQYREANPELPELWAYLQKVVIPRWAAGERFSIGPDGNPDLFKLSKDRVELPGGSIMHYRNLRKGGDRGNWIYDTGRGTVTLYGGKLCENLTQAACGVIVMDQMIETIDAGWPVKMMTYDELTALTQESRAEQCLNEMGVIMKRTPEWAPGLVLASEGGIGQRYGEAKT